MFSADGPEQVDRAACARPDCELAHVHVGQREQPPGLADGDHRHRAVAAARDDAATLERVEGEVDLGPAGADHRARRQPALVAGRAEDDAAADRQHVERPAHACRRPPPPRPPGRRGRASAPSAAPHARLRAGTPGTGTAAWCSGWLGERLHLGLRHTRSRARSAAESTSSATAPVARSALSFSITGTPSRSARSTM